MPNIIDYESDHYCPVYEKIISGDICYDSLLCLLGDFKVSSLEELEAVENIDEARIICKACPYSNLE